MIRQYGNFSKALYHCQKGRKRLWRSAMIVLGTVAGIYVVLMAGLTLSQRHMMYFPTKAPLALMEQYAQAHQFQAWRNSAGEVIGWKRLSTNQMILGQVLILHGNAGHALHRTDYADSLERVGAFDVYILEYPGYGARPGKPSQKSLFQAAAEGLSLLRPDQKIFLIGESLGTGVACYLASAGGTSQDSRAGTTGQRVAGIYLVAPYNSMVSVAQYHMKIFPVRLMLWDRYPSEQYLQKYSGPVGMLVGGRDTVIPARFGERLYDRYQGPKRLWAIPTASHDHLHFAPPEQWKQVVDFWLQPKQ